jgi:hypothetical protein
VYLWCTASNSIVYFIYRATKRFICSVVTGEFYDV